MQSQTKRRLTADQLDALMRESIGIGCRLEAEMTDGWFNAAYRVLFDDARHAIVKLAPPADAPVLRYERGIMATEAMVYRRAGNGGVPMPELLYAGADFLALSILDGITWDKVTDGRSHATLRRELGRITARLHTLAPENAQFGYPAAESDLSAPDWRTAFGAMVDALLDDATRWRSPLGITPAEVRNLVAAGGYALDEVTEPRLVHFDLWPGNVFISASHDGAAPRITGLIDHERAFWGDPAAELVSLAFGGDTGPYSDLVAGYTEAGGHLAFDPAFRHRLALYRLYLGLILVVECGPRGYSADRLASCRHTLDDSVAELRSVA